MNQSVSHNIESEEEFEIFFQVSIEAKEFTGLTRVKQHRLVTDSLKSEIAEMHGIRIHTAPSSGNAN